MRNVTCGKEAGKRLRKEVRLLYDGFEFGDTLLDDGSDDVEGGANGRGPRIERPLQTFQVHTRNDAPERVESASGAGDAAGGRCHAVDKVRVERGEAERSAGGGGSECALHPRRTPPARQPSR